MAESSYQPERTAPTPAEQFDAYLREVDAREATRPQRRSGVRTSWPQGVVPIAIGLALWSVILAGLSRQLLGWP